MLDLSRNGILDPETGAGFELGLKGEWFDGQLGATAAVFQQELDNRPIPDPGNGPSDSFSVSGGLERTDGIELEIAGTPLPGWTVGAASAWLDPNISIDRIRISARRPAAPSSASPSCTRATNYSKAGSRASVSALPC